MLQDSATSQANYERFISRVLESGEVWGIQHEDGTWATSESNKYEDTVVYLFWSDKAYAQRQCKEEWNNSEPSKILLDSFIDNWLKGMHEDGHLVGPNWDAQLFGKEIEPIEIAEQLTNIHS
ncbi:DUF2750 domain-containing protein [Microbulbifer thermotolerans]|uniref:DUF2750 domain-containing protein n=1 Tax=Microbulbifer thermotolerans TaxID=252514 RepID=UPI00224B9778|nr:DUF2750 domain-containing protein [Microbulbifer thermotolerans]MCX2840800.1 DUF2750 domain-containing protein [Microbulbifer thermotolerans]